MERRACTCSLCSACGRWGAGCRRFMNCLLPAGRCSFCCLQPRSPLHDHAATPFVPPHDSPSHPLCSPQEQALGIPLLSTSPPGSAGPAVPPATSLPDLDALKQMPFTAEQLDSLISAITDEVDRLDPGRSNSSSQVPISQRAGFRTMLEKYEEKKQICTSFVQTLPKELRSEVAGNGRSVVMPLLSQALGGVGGVHWLGVGITFIAWSLDNINDTLGNRTDCLRILRGSLSLLDKTKQVWEATSYQRNETLEESVETAVRCAIFCSSILTDSWIKSVLKASTTKDALVSLQEELESAFIHICGEILLHGMQSKMTRQVTFSISQDDIVGGREVMKEAVEFFTDDDQNLRAALLYGMGGIGKSTQALHIFSDFQQKNLYRTCRVELIVGNDHTETIPDCELCKIQKEIVRKVCPSAADVKVSNLTDGKQHLVKALQQINQYPVFLYVDNVLDPYGLDKLLPQASCFPSGSRLLVTARNNSAQGFFDLRIPKDSYKVMEVRKLSKEAAKQLLWKKLGSEAGKHRDNGEIASLEDEVLASCDGLPLALRVAGGYIGASSNN